MSRHRVVGPVAETGTRWRPLREPRQRIRIDPMLAGDLPFVVDMERESQAEPWSQKAFSEELASSRSLAFVARFLQGFSEIEGLQARAGGPSDGAPQSPGPVVGYICSWVVVDELHVLNVVVDEACRRRGVGRELLLHTFEEWRRRGVGRALLEARWSNLAARRLYEALGFQRVGERPGYYDHGGESAVLMELLFEYWSNESSDRCLP